MNTHDTNERRLLRVLLVDDERISLRHFASVLESLGSIELHRASNLAEARQVLAEVVVDIAFIDLQLSPDIRNRDGLTLIQEIRGRNQTVPVVVSGHSQHNEVREAMKLGARDYVLKTEFEQRVPLIIEGLLREREREDELLELRARGGTDPTLGLIGPSVAMQNLRALIRRVATANSHDPVPVLVLGPTGSGKELVAQAIHKLGSQSSAPFFDLNCGAIAETLIEAQLFGYVRGAFTDANRDQEGYFSLVGRGTLFLDEVAELSPALQTKLLRVLETRSFRPVGPTSREQHFRGRIVAATHVDLRESVREGGFREDLFHRLNVLIIHVPPLSEHREDIPVLVQHFAARHPKPLHFTHEAIEMLCQRPWQGNVRELRNAIDRLAILSDSECIDAEIIDRYLPADAEGASGNEPTKLLRQMAQKLLALPLEDKIDSITEALVHEAVEQAGGNITEAGRLLCIHRRAVERLLNRFSQQRKKTSGK